MLKINFSSCRHLFKKYVTIVSEWHWIQCLNSLFEPNHTVEMLSTVYLEITWRLNSIWGCFTFTWLRVGFNNRYFENSLYRYIKNFFFNNVLVLYNITIKIDQLKMCYGKNKTKRTTHILGAARGTRCDRYHRDIGCQYRFDRIQDSLRTWIGR